MESHGRILYVTVNKELCTDGNFSHVGTFGTSVSSVSSLGLNVNSGHSVAYSVQAMDGLSSLPSYLFPVILQKFGIQSVETYFKDLYSLFKVTEIGLKVI